MNDHRWEAGSKMLGLVKGEGVGRAAMQVENKKTK